MEMKAQVNALILGFLKDQNKQESRTEAVVGHEHPSENWGGTALLICQEWLELKMIKDHCLSNEWFQLKWLIKDFPASVWKDLWSSALNSAIHVEFISRNLSLAEAKYLVQTSNFILYRRLFQKPSSRWTSGMKLFALWRCLFLWIDFTGDLHSASRDLESWLLDL